MSKQNTQNKTNSATHIRRRANVFTPRSVRPPRAGAAATGAAATATATRRTIA